MYFHFVGDREHHSQLVKKVVPYCFRLGSLLFAFLLNSHKWVACLGEAFRKIIVIAAVGDFHNPDTIRGFDT